MYCTTTSSVTFPLLQQKLPLAHICPPQNFCPASEINPPIIQGQYLTSRPDDFIVSHQWPSQFRQSIPGHLHIVIEKCRDFTHCLRGTDVIPFAKAIVY
jgi:hypothetical protein